MGLNCNRHRDSGAVNTPQFFQKYGIVPVIQSLPAVLGSVSDTQKPEVSHFLEQFVKRGFTLGLPFVHIGVDLFFDEFSYGLAHHFMVFVEINLGC